MLSISRLSRKAVGVACLCAFCLGAFGVALQPPSRTHADGPEPLPTDSSWSYAPRTRPALPAVSDSSWPVNEIDTFVLARLEQAGMTPAPAAGRLALIRRATYDLTGLPPSPDRVQAFLADDSPDAYERLIDELLASEQYGVKWGRHWLDLVRWAETDSYERDRLKPGAWRYRDWVIDAFNADMPYDKFVTMQLAGDELPDESLGNHIATGFLHLGIRDDEPTDPLQALYDDLDGMLDTTSRVVLGASMGCARCHDHKKDPISAEDYYSMLAFFEGLKPYKVGYGNSINTENFVRTLPADLGTNTWEQQFEQWRRERRERITEIRNTVHELEERWGGDILASAVEALRAGEVLHLAFDEDEDSATPPGTARVEGHAGKAIRFAEPAGLRIDRPVAEDFTIAFWFRAETPGAGSESDPRWFLGSGLVDAEVPGIVDDFGVSLIGGRVAAGVGNPETFIASPTGYADGGWHHVAFVRDMQTGRISLWLDGVEVDAGVGGTQPLTAAEQVGIGRMQPGHRSFPGDLDEIRFWDRALDARQILDLAIDGGALPQHTELVRERLGEAESVRHDAAVRRLLSLKRPTRDMVQVLSAQELDTPMDSFVRVRGNAGVKGQPVEPRFPEVFAAHEPEIVAPADGASSGRRLALARWLTDPENPRTARVIANRLWQHHFGRGIVPTPNEFGELGERPTHPALLDWLASELVDGGWRLKRMHKLIMLSAAYQMDSVVADDVHLADPINQYFSRFNPRRLTAEEIRDSILAVNGTLNLETGGPGVYPKLPQAILATSSRPDSAWGESPPDQAARRSVYIHAKRSLLNPMLTSFDLADTDLTCPVRFVTTQPTQALTMLNSEFMNEQASIFADRLFAEHDGLEEIVRRGLELTLLRQADEREIAEGVRLINDLQEIEGHDRDYAVSCFCLVLLNLNEFVYLD